MLLQRATVGAAAAFLGFTTAFPSLSAPSSFGSFPEPNLHPRAACSGNTASSRSEWCDYSIDTDYMSEVPDTGVTREYWLELNEVTVAPDGVSRFAMAINGSIPGPTIYADWGDTVTVHVINSLNDSKNGTSMHFHGIRQNYTNQEDGVASVTQCPTAPGNTITYTWRATQYGSTWYHSHFALQSWQGIFGGLIINGPATANYDEDLGMLFLNDWDYHTVDQLFPEAEEAGPPTLATGLINGTNIGSTGGFRYNTTFTSGKTYRIRLVNAAVDTHWKFMIDNHTMTVIAADLVPITPYEATSVSIGIGQRYDIIVTANQASVADSFWLRAIPQSACSDITNADDIRGIIYYDGSTNTPNTTAHAYYDNCDDETPNLSPHMRKTVGPQSATSVQDATVSLNSESVFRWYLNSTTMIVDWADPTLLQVLNGTTAYSSSNAVIQLPNADQWMYLVVETAIGVPHPLHLHGHDFFILAQDTGAYSTSVSLNTNNPPRRDTVMLPSSGYVVIAFETDNPGAWLMHCHIGWHTSEGFALQFMERFSEIEALLDGDAVRDNCDTWSSFASAHGIVQADSGV